MPSKEIRIYMITTMELTKTQKYDKTKQGYHTCTACDITMFKSSFRRHERSKAHMKKAFPDSQPEQNKPKTTEQQEKKKAYNIEWANNNADKVKGYKRAYYKANKAKWDKPKQYYTCDICNSNVLTASKLKHEKTKKHINALSKESESHIHTNQIQTNYEPMSGANDQKDTMQKDDKL